MKETYLNNLRIKQIMLNKIQQIETPMGVKIICVIYYLSAVIALGTGVFSLIGATFLKDVEVLGTFTSVLGLGLITISVAQFFIAAGLWRGRRWARFLVMATSIMMIILCIILLFRGGGVLESVSTMLLNAGILIYCLLEKNAVAFFKSHEYF